MKPHPGNVERVRRIIGGVFKDENLADYTARVLAHENLISPTPADQHPGWMGVMKGFEVSVDKANRGSELLPVVRIDFNDGHHGEKAHFALRPYAAELLVESLTQAVEDTKRIK